VAGKETKCYVCMIICIFKEMNYIVVYIEWIYFETKQKLGIEILSELFEG